MGVTFYLARVGCSFDAALVSAKEDKEVEHKQVVNRGELHTSLNSTDSKVSCSIIPFLKILLGDRLERRVLNYALQYERKVKVKAWWI